MHKTSPGFLISIEGIDGVGKSTLAAWLKCYLMGRGYPVTAVKDPGSTTFSDHIRRLVCHQKFSKEIDPLAKLFAILAARAETIQKVIMPALQEGHIVITDRFNDSTAAYQSVETNMSISKIYVLCDIACQHLTPDITFILNMRAKAAMKRVAYRESHFKTQEQVTFDGDYGFYEKVADVFKHIALDNRDRVQIIPAAEKKGKALAITISHLNRLESFLLWQERHIVNRSLSGLSN